MRMVGRKIGWRIARRDEHLIDRHRGKNAMVAATACAIIEQAKEKKDIARPDTLPFKVALRGIGLTKGAAAIGKERVVVAMVVRADPPPAGAFGILAQPERGIGRRARVGSAGNRQRHRYAIDDR